MSKRAAIVLAVAVGLLGGLVSAGGFLYLTFSGPRMQVQPHIRAFDAAMPLPPAGSVPVYDLPYALPPEDAARTMASPVEDTPANRERGKLYYGYYCSFCHGEAGKGDGPVGDSFIPRPDLHPDKLRAASDGQLLRAMLLGPGHDPVLPRIVPAPHRWYLVLHLKGLLGR